MRKASKALLWALVAVAFLGVTAGVSYLVGSRLLVGGRQVASSGEAVLYHAGKFLTNLRDEGGRRFISVDLTLELSHARLGKELDAKQAMLRDLVIAVLRDKTYPELEGEGGMVALSRELAERINGLAQSGKVLRIFFTDFVIQ